LTFSSAGHRRFKDHVDEFRKYFIIRQQEITNSPEIIHRLGLISMNTALEMDVFGNVNSTHVFGSKLMNGIGGSADFTRNCFLPIFMSPSTSKGGKISNIVPMVTHTDQSEHSTQIFVTEQGLADLRGLSPTAKAREIISKCAHPRYRSALLEHLEASIANAPGRQVPVDLAHVFDFHLNYLNRGDMLKFS
jgi:acyl-CoA hydrolase